MHNGMRCNLEIKQFPVASADSAYRIRTNSKDFQTTFIHINSPGSPIPIETSIASLVTLKYHHRGSPINWIVVSPQAKTNFESKIREEFKQSITDPECSQFIKHLNLWLIPAMLDLWHIKYFRMTQNQGQLLFLFPDAYYWGWCPGQSIVETKYHAGTQWDCRSYAFCNLRSSLCASAHDGQIPLYLKSVDDECESSSL